MSGGNVNVVLRVIMIILVVSLLVLVVLQLISPESLRGGFWRFGGSGSSGSNATLRVQDEGTPTISSISSQADTPESGGAYKMEPKSTSERAEEEAIQRKYVPDPLPPPIIATSSNDTSKPKRSLQEENPHQVEDNTIPEREVPTPELYNLQQDSVTMAADPVLTQEMRAMNARVGYMSDREKRKPTKNAGDLDIARRMYLRKYSPQVLEKHDQIEAENGNAAMLHMFSQRDDGK